MSRPTRWSPLAVLGASLRSSSAPVPARRMPEPERRRAERPLPASRRRESQRHEPAAVPTGVVYPADRRRARAARAAVHRRAQEDHRDRRADRRVPALQSGRRLPAEDRVQRRSASRMSDWLAKHAADGSYLDPSRTAPGPTCSSQWDKGNRIVFEAIRRLLGREGQDAERSSSAGATRPPSACSSSSPATSTASTTRAPSDIATIQADSSLQFAPRPGLNTLYLGLNNTIKPWDNDKVRQAIAMGIDRQRIVDNFYPAGSTVADYFTPCAISFACEGDKTWGFDAAAAKAAARRGAASRTASRPSSRSATPSAATCPTRRSSRPRSSQQLKANLGIDATLDLQESGTFLDNAPPASSTGIFMLGWGADYPDPSNFLDYHFGSGSGKKFGKPFPDIVDALNTGARDGRSGRPHGRLHHRQQPDQGARPGGHRRPRRLRRGLQGRRRRRATPPSSAPRVFATMKAGDRDTLVFMQNAEPLSLYCGDETDGETLRACEQIGESLYGYKIGSAESDPGPRHRVQAPTPTRRSGPAPCATA